MGILPYLNACKVAFIMRTTSYLKLTFSLAFTWLAVLPTSVHASADLAKKSTCMGCHAAERKVVGPSYKAIAARYQNQPRAQVVDALAKKIRLGGSGAWGIVVMPANTKLSDADAKVLAEWILDGAK
jgi:cytochrome c